MPRNESVATTSPAPSRIEVGTQTLLVTIPQAARMLSSTVWSVRGLLWAKKIPHVQIGRRFLIDPADLHAYVRQLKAGAA
jgi:excisionase family DNA binding protein